VLQDSLQTAAAHHKVLESQLTDSVAIVEALSNNNLHCDALTSAAILVSKLDLCFEFYVLLKYAHIGTKIHLLNVCVLSSHTCHSFFLLM